MQNDVVYCLYELIEPLTGHMLTAANARDIQTHAILEHFPNALDVVDASAVFIHRADADEADYDSGQYRAQNAKM
jgi:hypothetical protein